MIGLVSQQEPRVRVREVVTDDERQPLVGEGVDFIVRRVGLELRSENLPRLRPRLRRDDEVLGPVGNREPTVVHHALEVDESVLKGGHTLH